MELSLDQKIMMRNFYEGVKYRSNDYLTNKIFFFGRKAIHQGGSFFLVDGKKDQIRVV